MAVEAIYQRMDDAEKIIVKQIGRKKTIVINGTAIGNRRDIVSNIPCVVFCHDDIGFVSGTPEMQRWFFNQTLTLVDRDYLDLLRMYNRILRSRNAALKAGRTEILDALDHQLLEAGIPVTHRRRDLSSRFSDVLGEQFAEVFESDERLRMEYRSSWPEDSPQDEVSHRRDMDIRLATTTAGPHRDRFIFRLGDSLLTNVASTGQLRLVSLILRVVQAQLIGEGARNRPVLLLDDVLLELDPRRRARFIAVLPEYEQAFFTFLPGEQYAPFRDGTAKIYDVEGGSIRAQS